MKKVFKTFVCFVLAIGILDAALVFGVGESHTKVQKADAIVILGAAIYSPALYNRSIKGLELYKEGKANEIILSGGRISDKDLSEAAYMKKVIVQNSSTKPVMELDEQSHNTYENIKNAKLLAPEAKSIIIVSDKFHLARAVLLAKRAGFEDVYWSSPEPTYYRTPELLYYYAREMAAMVAYVPKFVDFY